MFIDLVFMQLPQQLARESEGLSELSPQLIENSEFSTFLPIIEQALLPAVAGGFTHLPALRPGHADPDVLLNSGKTLPSTGETLPAPLLPRVFAHPLSGATAQMAGEPDSVMQVLPHRAGDTASSIERTLVPGAAGGVAALRVEFGEAPGKAPLNSSTLLPPTGERSTVGLPARAFVESTVTFDNQGGGQALGLERQLPPQLSVALHNVRQPRTVQVETPVEILTEPSETSLELQPRIAANHDAPRTRAPSVATLTLNIDRPNWQPTLGERLVWMVSHGQQRAEIQLEPPQLGRVDVHIVMQGDRAQLAFAADTPASRELLEQSLPRLREMMSDAGIDLTDVNVENRQQQASQQDQEHREQVTDVEPQVSESATQVAGLNVVSGDHVLLDLFV
ncbi:MAG: flagellar hook-length control protein FliK [Gammaproteobacteria bacterium]|nr:flagellar hook-length control protein FliK [Gammaproteobacteria bacterium]